MRTSPGSLSQMRAALFLRAGLHVTVEAVVGEIEFSADKPLGPGRLPLQNLVPLLEPVEFFGGASPEFFGLLDRLFVEGVVFGQALDLGLLGKFGGGLKAAGLVESRIDVYLRDGCFSHGSSSVWILFLRPGSGPGIEQF